MYTYKTAFIVILTLIVIFFIFKNTQQSDTLQEYKKDKKLLKDQNQNLNYQLDSIIKNYNDLYLIIDSLPLGKPLDTIIYCSGKSNYGWRLHPVFKRWRHHDGVDLEGTFWDTVYSTSHGIVRNANWMGGYGRCIIVDHAFDYSTRYGHLYKMFVKKGDTIHKGQAIGKVGNSGVVTGQHLHYEIRYEDQHINPEKFLSFSR